MECVINKNGLLRKLEMLDDVYLVGYADVVAAVITLRSIDLAQLRLNQVIHVIKTWIEEHGLQLAIAKTEMVLLTRRRIPTLILMVVLRSYARQQAELLGTFAEGQQ